MKDYTAIGTIVYNTNPPFNIFLAGICKSIRASKHSLAAVYAREIENEIHPELQQRPQREDLQQAFKDNVQHHPRQ